MTKDHWFKLQQVAGLRLWMPAPAAMSTVMEVFNKDRLAHYLEPPYVCCATDDDESLAKEPDEGCQCVVYGADGDVFFGA